MQQIMMPQCDYKARDLTDECGTTPMQEHDYFPYSKNDMHFPMHLFINIAPEWVDHLSDDTDGMKIYRIKYLPKGGVERTHDLRYFRCILQEGKAQ